MDMFAAGIAVGTVVVAALAVLVAWRWRLSAERAAGAEQKVRAEELTAFIEQARIAFDALSRQALSANTADFLTVAKSRFDEQTHATSATLEEKKKLIDARLEEMGAKLSRLNNLIQDVEK